MTTDDKKDKAKDEEQYPTKASTTSHEVSIGDRNYSYEAVADWIELKKKNKPLAKMFHVAYFLQQKGDSSQRPLTFVFNGGPGAASAYLHMGVVGPKRIVFEQEGATPPPPTQVVDNLESWLPFTDLVFIDPIGTGFSRPLDKPDSDTKDDAAKKAAAAKDEKEKSEFWEVERDLEALGEFIQSFLSKYSRWTSPMFLAGESYGGFRVAKMARKIQENYGVGLNGAILISPAIEFSSLMGSDYDMSSWLERFPTMAAVAHSHGKATALPASADLQEVLVKAESFAKTDLLSWLTRGNDLSESELQNVVDTMSAFTGLPAAMIRRSGGRIDLMQFCRQLLREEERLVGFYDGSISSRDPYPNRDAYDGPDPTLMSIDRLFTAGVNHHLRDTLAVETDMNYRLLSMQVNSAWKFTKDVQWPELLGAMDDLRYGMSLNPHMKVMISHGYYDLVTPYYSSNRLCQLMRLDPELASNLQLQHYKGGHMFYTWEESRIALLQSMQEFYRSAVGT